MEKDIVIEEVSGVGAFMRQRIEKTDPHWFNEDEKEFSELRFQLSRLTPEEIDFDAVVDRCKAMRKKYESMPFNAFNLRMGAA